MVELRIPGPTPCPPEVLQAMTKQMIDHRGKEFGQIFTDVTDKLKQLFQTKNDLFILTGSGTGGMEAAVVNTLSPGDRVLAVSIGAFGDRFANIAKAFGADVVPLQFELGKPADPDVIRRTLREDAAIKAVLVTHNETSTGVTNDLAAISKVVKEFDKLLMVDAISSLGSLDLPVDEWHCDVAISGSQKGWMVPPGLTMVSFSQEAWRAHAQAKMPRFYWDFTQAKNFLARGGQTPWTPAVATVYAFSAALNILAEEGLPNIVARHARIGKKVRNGVKALGLKLLADEKYASNTVTAVWPPEGVDPGNLRRVLREKHQVVLAGGQGKLDGKIFRIGHLGWVDEANIERVLLCLKLTLEEIAPVKAQQTVK
ncbi:MAG: alanine--glyoxylate aminotransferase family protein [Chloroflexi bacterium]|nr:alanine--glyoxylate aminotransferase family protein [Chloroflexota bacterium]